MAEYSTSDCEEVVYAIDEGKGQLMGKVQPIAALEGLLLDPTMALARDSFCQQNCDKLQESSAEMEQQTLFEQYQAVMESTFQKQQQQQYWTDGPMFTLQELAEQLEGQGNCNEEVCELLRSVTALSAFVGLLGDFRDAETARAADDGPLELQGSKAGLHAEEQEDGEERPDLDLSLNVTTLTPAA